MRCNLNELLLALADSIMQRSLLALLGLGNKAYALRYPQSTATKRRVTRSRASKCRVGDQAIQSILRYTS